MLNLMMRMLVLTGLCLHPLALVGCGSEDHDHHHTQMHDDEIRAGCHHIESGSAVPLPTHHHEVEQVSVHLRYDVGLWLSDSESSETFYGRVAYQSPGGTHYLFFTETVSATITDVDGNTVEAIRTDNEDSIDGCSGAKSLVIVSLPAGEYTITIEIQASMMSSVGFTVHKAGDSHDHHNH